VRTEQNWIGGASPLRRRVCAATGRVCGGSLVRPCRLRVRRPAPALLQAALARAQFETIHPFADGNGRVGRALIQLVLRRRGVATRVLPPVSLVLATRADDYVNGLDGTRSDSTTAPGIRTWLELLLLDTGRACRDADQFAGDLAVLEADWRKSLGRVRAKSATDLFVTALPSLPVFSVTTAAAAIGRTFQATSDAVERLRGAGVVRQVSLGRRNRAFEAVGLFEAFTGFERSLASPDADTNVSAPARGPRASSVAVRSVALREPSPCLSVATLCRMHICDRDGRPHA
jgi:Fic/DOC family